VKVDQGLLMEAMTVLALDERDDHTDEQLIELSVTTLDSLIADMGEVVEGCDHSVGICMCREIAVLEGIRLARDGKKVCPSCQGEGLVYDPRSDDDDREAFCPMCGSNGTIERGE